jgi:lipoprotein signal peptidase
LLYFLLAAIIIALDQWTKKLVLNNMELGESIPLIADVFHLTSHRNMRHSGSCKINGGCSLSLRLQS